VKLPKGSDFLLTLNIHKDDRFYVVEYVSKVGERIDHQHYSKDSLFESIYKLGRHTHINNVHFCIPRDLSHSLLSFLSIEFPGELYEHKITIND
jgi:hypothetical protein